MLVGRGDCKVFKGDSTSWSDIMYTVKDDKIYKGDSTSWSDIKYTIQDM